jgi:hypothetical protein
MQFRIFNAKNFTTLTITSLCFNQDVCNSSQFCNYVSIRKYAILDSFQPHKDLTTYSYAWIGDIKEQGG